jgi:hypothetical protein
MRHLVARPPDCARRQNEDRSLESVCRRCGLTIARAFHPNDLEALERRHVCQVVERRRSIRIAYRIYDPHSQNCVRLLGAAPELRRCSCDFEPLQWVNSRDPG